MWPRSASRPSETSIAALREAAQRLTEREARLRQAVALDQMRARRGGRGSSSPCSTLQAERGIAERARRPRGRRRAGRRSAAAPGPWAPGRARSARARAARASTTVSPPSRPIAERRLVLGEPAAELGEPVVGGRLGPDQREQVAERRCAHRGEVGEVDPQQLLRDRRRAGRRAGNARPRPSRPWSARARCRRAGRAARRRPRGRARPGCRPRAAAAARR